MDNLNLGLVFIILIIGAVLTMLLTNKEPGLLNFAFKKYGKHKGEDYSLRDSVNNKIEKIKSLNKLKIKNFFLGTNFRRGWLTSLVVYILLISIGFIYLYPVLYMLSNSLKSLDDIVNPAVNWVPTRFYFENFKQSFAVLKVVQVLPKSLLVTLLPALLQTGVCAVIGYGFCKFQFKGKFLVLILVILAFIVPAQVYMIPKYVLFYNMGFLKKGSEGIQFLSIVLPALFGQGLNSSIFILIFFQFFKMIPYSLNEAAEIDGCGPYRTFFTIGVPLAGPAFIICFLFGFVWYWNESYFLSMFAPEYPNLQIRLSLFISEYTAQSTADPTMSKINEGVRLAATLIILLPMLLIYLFMQKWFVEGIERSGITGE